MSVTWLPDLYGDLVPSEHLLGIAHPHNPLVRRILWGDRTAEAELVGRYEALHPIWTSWAAEHEQCYTLPLEAALASCAPAVTLEISAGTGQATPLVSSVASTLVCSEPSSYMANELLARTGALVVRAASLLPFADASFDRIVGLNAVPCASELRRVLVPGGAVTLCYSFAEQTPVFVEPLELSRALGLSAVCQRVGFGMAVVLTDNIGDGATKEKS